MTDDDLPAMAWPPHPPEDITDAGRVVFTVCVDPGCDQCPGFAYHWHAVE